jgi:hypothetical protein
MIFSFSAQTLPQESRVARELFASFPNTTTDLPEIGSTPQFSDIALNYPKAISNLVFSLILIKKLSPESKPAG